jgi:hypothetical protein
MPASLQMSTPPFRISCGNSSTHISVTKQCSCVIDYSFWCREVQGTVDGNMRKRSKALSQQTVGILVGLKSKQLMQIQAFKTHTQICHSRLHALQLLQWLCRCGIPYYSDGIAAAAAVAATRSMLLAGLTVMTSVVSLLIGMPSTDSANSGCNAQQGSNHNNLQHLSHHDFEPSFCSSASTDSSAVADTSASTCVTLYAAVLPGSRKPWLFQSMHTYKQHRMHWISNGTLVHSRVAASVLLLCLP